MRGYKGFIINDWGKLHAMGVASPEGRAKASAFMQGAMQAYMDAPLGDGQKFRAKIAEFTSKGDFPAQVLDYIEKYTIGLQPLDLSWQQVFDAKDFTGTTQSGFALRNVTSGLAFEEILPGEKVKLVSISGAETQVLFRLFGAGLQYDQVWWDDQRWWDIEDETANFRNQQYYKLAKIHIALVEALDSGVNQAWDTNLVTTLNNACAQLIADAANTGVPVGDNPTFTLWAPLVKKPAVMDALRANYLNTDSALNKPIHYNIIPAFSNNFSVNTVGYLALPKGKMKSGNRMGLQIFGQFDILSYSTAVAGYFRQGAAIGDKRQVRRIPFSG